MKNITLFLFFNLISSILFSQTNLSGYITIQNSKGKSAYPAQIKSWGATDTDINSENGKFILKYDKKKPGETASIEVIRDGYEVVNKNDLTINLPEDHTKQRPLKIFLCPKGQWRTYADQYYKTNIQSINKTYEQQLLQIKKQYNSVTLENNNYRNALFELDEKRKIAESQAEKMAEHFAKINLDDATDRFSLAHRLFTSGKLDSVLLVLNEADILADYSKALKQIKKGKDLIKIGKRKRVNGLEAKEKIVDEFMIKARAHIIKFQWEKAERSFEIAISADSSNLENTFEYASYNKNQHEFNRALILFNDCLKFVEPQSRNHATILDHIGVIHYENHNNIKAKEKYLEAIAILKNLNSKQSIVNENISRQLALSFQHLGLLQITDYSINEKDLDEVEKTYRNVINIQNELIEKDSQKYSNDLLSTYSILSKFYIDHDFFEKGVNYILKAQNIFTKLGQEETPKYYTFLTIIGDIYLKEQDYSSAEKYMLKAFNKFNSIAKQNPKAYKIQAAQASGELAELYVLMQQFPKAIERINYSININKQLAKVNPHYYEIYLVDNYFILGLGYLGDKQFYKAKNNLIKSLELNKLIVKKGKQRKDEAYQIIFSNLEDQYQKTISTLKKIGDIHYEIGTISSSPEQYSKELLLKSKEVFEYLYLEKPETYNNDLGHTLFALGAVYYYDKDYTKSELNYQRVLDIYTKTSDTSETQIMIAKSATMLGIINSTIEDENYTQAETYFSKALVVYLALNKKQPNEFLLDIKENIIALSYFNFNRDDQNKANEILINDAIKVFDELPDNIKKKNINHIKDIRVALFNQFNELEKSKKNEQKFQTALNNLEKLNEIDSQSYKSELGELLIDIADFHTFETKNYSEAANHIQFALELFLELLPKDSLKNDDNIRDIIMSMRGIIFYSYYEGKKELEANQLDLVQSKFEFSLNLIEKLLPIDSFIIHRRGETFTSLGNFYIKKGDFKNAEKNHLLAIKDYKYGLELFPEKNIQLIENTYHILAGLSEENNYSLNTEKYHLKSIDFIKKISKNNPQKYMIMLSEKYNDIGLFYLKKNKLKQAENQFLSALQNLKNINPDTLLSTKPLISNAHNFLGVIYTETKKFDKAEYHYKNAIIYNRQLSQIDPNTYNSFLSSKLKDFGLFYHGSKIDFNSAEKYYLESHEIYLLQSKHSPKENNIKLAEVQYLLAWLYLSRLELDSSHNLKWKEKGNEWLELSKKSLDIYPQNHDLKTKYLNTIQEISEGLKKF